jgi:hypothetical protein
MKRIWLRGLTSPKVLAISASLGLIATAYCYMMILNSPRFRGDFWTPLRSAGFPFAIVFLLCWVSLSFILGPGRASESSVLGRLAGRKQAATLNRLARTGRWKMDVSTHHGEAILLLGKGITDAHLLDLTGIDVLTSLDLRDCPVTDSGLVALKHLKRLFCLNLRGTKVTDAGLARLKGLPRLGKLDVDGTAVTDAGLRAAGLIEKKYSSREQEEGYVNDMIERLGSINTARLVFPRPPRSLTEPVSGILAMCRVGLVGVAEWRARQALAIAEADCPSSTGTGAPWVARCLALVGAMENAQEKWADAEPRLQRALGIAEAELGPVHRELEWILWHLGQAQRAQKRFASAEENLKRSLELAERYSLDTGEHHAELALLYASRGRIEAQPHFDQAVTLLEKSIAKGGDTAPVIRFLYVRFLRQFAAALRERGRVELAGNLEAKSRKLLRLLD